MRSPSTYRRGRGDLLCARLALFDPGWRLVATSPDFFFQHRGVEFCAGIARVERDYVFSYGVNDGAANLMWLSAEQVDTLIAMRAT